MSISKSIHINATRYFEVASLANLEDTLKIDVTEHCFLPRDDDLQADWVASVAIPAFRLIRMERGDGRCLAFCTIGTGAGIDALAAVETLNARFLGITDVHEDVVKEAENNIRRNLKSNCDVSILAGTGDLLTPLAPLRPHFDVIYENLPNVTAIWEFKVDEERISSGFLNPRTEAIPKVLEDNMLSLHYLALQQAQDFLKEDGVVLSMLGARVALRHFLDMAEKAGYQGRFLTYGWKVQAQAQEILKGHADWQDQGLGPFYFYHIKDLKNAFEGLAPNEAAPRALGIEKKLQPLAMDAKAALAAFNRGETIGHAYVVLASEKKKS